MSVAIGPQSLLARTLIGLIFTASWAADPSKPHPHQGTLEPFAPGPPPKLSAAELSTLDAGKPVQKTIQFESGTGARAVAVFDVPAPPSIVWDCINDVKAYPRMVSGVSETQILSSSKLPSGGSRTGAKYSLGVLGYKLSYFLDMKYEPQFNSMTFHLDYSKYSDLDDTVGYWHVAPLKKPNGETHSRVTYSAALTLRGWFPKAVVDILMATTLGRSTMWVSTESKLRLAAAAPASSSGADRKVCRWTWRGRRCKQLLAPSPPPAPPTPAYSYTTLLTYLLPALLALYVLEKIP